MRVCLYKTDFNQPKRFEGLVLNNMIWQKLETNTQKA